MSITINSNILSLNAQRRLGQHTSNLRSSFEKLSSGLRVSKASDDAAGLAISENLKTDARLSSQALRNVNDGISMISIISGALDSQKSILFRMAELAEQSANGVNSSKQRSALQKEYQTLQEEFDRVASAANFNGISLLRNSTPHTVSVMAGITGADSSLLKVAAANSHLFSGELGARTIMRKVPPISVATSASIFSSAFTDPEFTSLDGERVQDYGVIKTTDSLNNDVEIKIAIFSDFFQLGYGKAYRNGESSTSYTIQENIAISNNTLSFTFSNLSDGATVNAQLDVSGLTFNSLDDDNNARTSAIGFTNIEGKSSSKEALDAVRNRIDELSKIQGSFGAIESRLNFAASKLLVDRENYLSASSQISDVDVATESSNLAKTQILQQAATSILAQANQQPSIALQLLGGL